jgi:hypothetical protein
MRREIVEMVDAWTLALETLIYARPSWHRSAVARRVTMLARGLAMAGSPGDLRRHYARVCARPTYSNLRDVTQDGEVLSPRQVADAAFGLRHLEITTGHLIDLGVDQVSAWLLTVAS